MDETTVRPEELPSTPSWVPFSTSCAFLFRHPRLLGLSLLLMLLIGTLTWLGYLFTVDLINHFTGSFFTTPPLVEKFWHWPLLWGWQALRWVFVLLSRVVAFYLAFILAYSLTTPGYAFLSSWAGNRYCTQAGEGEAVFSLAGALIDLREGIKIGAMGIVVTIAALVANFVPVIGQATVFVLYAYYSALMFVDYPASRYRWTLGQKLGWLRLHSGPAFRLGLFPALISMVPLLNIFLMALCFPLFTIHTTLNFLTIEGRKEILPVP
ncbi:MAG: EI24 domain-containing protein [Proteobacteria bacterium]|nr:EI24 domain-containing protein [Pseudomonadota bacterium]